VVPTASAIIGGVSLIGGNGTPPAQAVATGGVLFVVAIADAVDLDPRLFAIRRYWSEILFRRDGEVSPAK
jgi:hypothetical protein